MVLKRTILAFSAIALLAGCGLTSNRPAEVDLLSLLPHASRRAGGDPDIAIRADIFVAAGDGRMALVLEAPARVTWNVRLPLHARLRAAVAGDGRLRVGASNGRTYQEVGRFDVTGAWAPIDIDLRDLSEVKWSLFHQPLRTNWELIFNADVTASGRLVAVDRPFVIRP